MQLKRYFKQSFVESLPLVASNIFVIWVFFHEHSWFMRQLGNRRATSLTRLYYFHPLHRHLDISWVITTGVHLCTSAHSQQPDWNRKPLVSKSKLLSTELRTLKISGYTVFALWYMDKSLSTCFQSR